MPIITKELAERIAKKLGAEVRARQGRAHAIAAVRVEGKVVAVFGLRHGSSKDLGHDHIPNDLHVTPREARELGQCPMSRDQWIARLREKDLL